MQRRFHFLYIIWGFFFFALCPQIFSENAFADESIEINLKKELKKGNFLIGLKQYLGGSSDKLIGKKNIIFSTENSFIDLYSANGIKHRSKKINILFKNVPLKTTQNIQRLVFGPFSSYETAQRKARNLRSMGYEPVVTYPKNWEVWIKEEKKLLDKKLNYKFFKKSIKSKIVPFLTNKYTQYKLEGPIYITSDQEVKINNVNFGKKFYLVKDSYGTWTLIQKIKFDKYLEGVLPHEIGSKAPVEALKAQAVIARTWAIYNSGRFNFDQYHLCITTQCQVYKKPNLENPNIKKAIKDTKNLIITYRDKPINSFYHGSNGGIASSASEAWKIEDYFYFFPMIDGEDNLNQFFELPIKNENQLNIFLDSVNEKAFGENHSLFRWKRVVSSEKIQEYLVKNQLIKDRKDFVNIKITQRGFSGRVIKMEIQVSNSNKMIVLERDDIRRILNFLPSTLFTINKLNDNYWIFKGGGFGHGVGLSQAGAIEMAEMGFTYEQILNHYYRGTKIKKIEILSQ